MKAFFLVGSWLRPEDFGFGIHKIWINQKPENLAPSIAKSDRLPPLGFSLHDTFAGRHIMIWTVVIISLCFENFDIVILKIMEPMQNVA